MFHKFSIEESHAFLRTLFTFFAYFSTDPYQSVSLYNAWKLTHPFVVLFKKHILLSMLLQLSQLFPLYPPVPNLEPHFPPAIPPLQPLLSSCPWAVHISSLASPFPILFWTSLAYFVPENYASLKKRFFFIQRISICYNSNFSFKGVTHAS